MTLAYQWGVTLKLWLGPKFWMKFNLATHNFRAQESKATYPLPPPSTESFYQYCLGPEYLMADGTCERLARTPSLADVLVTSRRKHVDGERQKLLGTCCCVPSNMFCKPTMLIICISRSRNTRVVFARLPRAHGDLQEEFRCRPDPVADAVQN